MVSPKSYKMGQVTTYKNWDSYLIFLLLDLNPIFFFLDFAYVGSR